MATARNFRSEYDNYQGKPEQIKRRAARNKARREMEKAGKVRKGDNKDVGHADGNPLNNKRSNWNVESEHANRSYPRTKKAGKKNPHD